MQIFWLLLEGYARDEDYAIKIQGMSPVLAACKEWEWKPGILEEIIDRLPKLLHVRDENGGTPLHSAALAGNWMAVTVLLRACPYLALQTDKDGSYPIHIACEGGDCVTISALIDDTWSDLAEIKNNKGQNILHVAAKAGNNEAVRYILGECRELVKLKDVDGNTPLHLASRHNHCEVLRSLVQGRNILIKARVPRSKDRDVRSPREQSSKASKPSRAKWIKAEMDTQLLVATLVASVTFTAGVTLPGGYNASDDRHPGMATTLHKGVFQLFVICDALAMYNSILAVVVLLGGNGSDIRIAKRAYTIAGSLLLWAFISMAVAFLAAIIVAVSKLIWLMTLVLCIAVLYIGILLGYYYPLIGPRGKVYR
ncbi:protein ACCELERATED CELL DEATH 6-like isoform X2 [Syzygium oleosum]|uniref:protein ACCELERATED CELL DEATH 6-like isoform X2 n=1 Tax=Syzygium oleosum TaxID=219896 RepID=UPI0024B91FDF|nr:protein ACCELERATED CELL DEATH 6-like isoform X2 [Syzygium oleosum]